VLEEDQGLDAENNGFLLLIKIKQKLKWHTPDTTPSQKGIPNEEHRAQDINITRQHKTDTWTQGTNMTTHHGRRGQLIG